MASIQSNDMELPLFPSKNQIFLLFVTGALSFFLLVPSAFAVFTDVNPNSAITETEVRDNLTLPVGFYYGQESTSFTQPNFDDNPTWNTSRMNFTGGAITPIYNNNQTPVLVQPYIFVEAFDFDNTQTYRVIFEIDINMDDENSADDFVFGSFIAYNISTNTSDGTTPTFQINSTTDIGGGQNEQFFVNPTYTNLGNGFFRYQAELNNSVLNVNSSQISVEISRNGNWNGNFTLTSFAVQQDIPEPEQETLNDTSFGAILIIIGVVMAVGSLLLIFKEFQAGANIQRIITLFAVLIIAISFIVVTLSFGTLPVG